MSMRTRREYGLPWPWHLLRAPHPPRPAGHMFAVRPRRILGRTLPCKSIGHAEGGPIQPIRLSVTTIVDK
jgi:hypothetical protein